MESEEKTLALINSIDNYRFYVTDRRIFFMLTKLDKKLNKTKIAKGAMRVAIGAAFGASGAPLVPFFGTPAVDKRELKGISIPFNEIYFCA